MLNGDKGPLDYQLLVYAWVLLLSMWGGVANYIFKLRQSVLCCFSFAELLGDLVISGLTGLLTFYLCELAELPLLLTAALVGISGHMGSRGIFLMERLMDRRLKNMFGMPEEKNKEDRK